MAKRIIFVISFLFSVNIVYCQNDFRNVNWGMTIGEVKNLETSPLTNEAKNLTGFKNGKEYYDGINLKYDGVKIGGEVANLTYYFENGKLSKVSIKFIPTTYRRYDEGISRTISMFEELYSGFQRKGLKITQPLQCGNHVYEGRDYSNPDNNKIMASKDWSFNKSNLALIEKMITERKYKAVFFRMESPRSNCSMMFLTNHSEWQQKEPVTLELTPSYSLKNKLKESDF